MTILAVLAKNNRQRGVISWSFNQDGDNYVAIRNDGRRFPCASLQEMRDGYKHIRDDFGFARVA